jgi:hypothetical protein
VAALFQSHEGRIERALIERERLVGDLFQPCGERVGVQGAHGRERLQHNHVQRPLEELHGGVRHGSNADILLLVCQVDRL